MPFTLNTRYNLLKRLMVIAIGAVPIVSGLLVMNYHLGKKLAETSQISVQEAVFSVDQLLDRMVATFDRANDLAGKPCVQVSGKLHDIIAISPHLRSLALTANGEAYCATEKDPMAYISAFIKSGRGTELAFDVPSSPNAAILRVQTPGRNSGVVGTLYGIELRKELKSFQTGLTLILEFGDHYIWTDGDSRDPERPSQDEFSEWAESKKYGYTVRGGYSKGYTANEFRMTIAQVLPSLALVGVATSLVLYLGLMRARKAHSGTAVRDA